MMVSIAALTALILASPAHAGTASVYTDSLRAFSVDIPAAWHASAEHGDVVGRRDVFLCVNNHRSGLHLKEERVGETRRFPVEKELPAGTIYVAFAYAGEPGEAEYGPWHEDNFEQERRFFIVNPHVYRKTADLDWYDLSFTIWGADWKVWVICRKPYAPSDRQLAFDMVTSLRFRERPVVNAGQAVGLAVNYLPELAEPQPEDCRTGGWPANGGRHGGYETRIERVGPSFIVTFARYLDADSHIAQATWHFLVQPDGTVTPLGGE